MGYGAIESNVGHPTYTNDVLMQTYYPLFQVLFLFFQFTAA